VIFLDDHPANVAGAEAVGMRALLVGSDPTEAIAELDALLA
jgi:FMN phosphatase YigB (HAD superfamily)